MIVINKMNNYNKAKLIVGITLIAIGISVIFQPSSIHLIPSLMSAVIGFSALGLGAFTFLIGNEEN